MADQRLKPDPNFKNVMGGVTESGGEVRPLLVDDVTGYLLVDVTASYTGVQNAEAVDATDFGTLILGTDGTNYRVVKTDSDGNLQVDIVSGGGGGTQYATNVAYADGNTGTLAITIRDDALATLTEVDGDFSGLRVDSTGALWSRFTNTTIATTNTGTFVVQVDGSALTALQNIDTDTTTIISHLDGVEGLLTTIDADTGNISTKIDTLAGAVSGSEMQVDVLTIAAGDNNIGNVDIVTVPTDPFGANADAASATGSISAKLRFIAATGIPITGTVATSEVVPTTIYNGKKTVTTAGTRVTLASSQAVKSVTIKALAANTGIIYVGDGSVASTTGFALAAGETISMDIANLSTVNLDSSVNGEGVTYIAIG